MLMMVINGRAPLCMSPLDQGLLVCRRSDLSAADGVPRPNRPSVGVELRAEQGEGQALLSRAHGEC